MVCFVILHYMVYDETVQCVETLLHRIDGNKQIIIVDNASSNNSGKKLKDKYKKYDNVLVLLNKENSGFARGNNVGYRYAKKQFSPDYIVVMNNDIELTQKDFINQIERIYQTEKYAVLSPDIYSTSSQVHQSPKRLTSVSLEEAKHLYSAYEKKLKSQVVVPARCYLKKFSKLKLFYYQKRSQQLKIDYTKKYYNVPLHGSCFIFAKPFIEKRKDAFFEGTFFYFESEILDYECQRDGLLELYDPSIQVLHHQNISTSAVYSSDLKKVRFMNRCNYDSIGTYIDLVEKDNG